MAPLRKTPRRSGGWYAGDLAEATASALAIFKAEERFLEVVINSRPREPGPITRRMISLRAVETRYGEEAHSG